MLGGGRQGSALISRSAHVDQGLSLDVNRTLEPLTRLPAAQASLRLLV